MHALVLNDGVNQPCSSTLAAGLILQPSRSSHKHPYVTTHKRIQQNFQVFLMNIFKYYLNISSSMVYMAESLFVSGSTLEASMFTCSVL